MRKGTLDLDSIGPANALLGTDATGRIVDLGKPASKTPASLTDGAVISFDVRVNYNFTLAAGAGNKTLTPANLQDGDAWAIAISGCAGQVVTFGPTSGYDHRLGGNNGVVTTVTLPASGTVILAGLRMGATIFWNLTQY